MKNKKISNSKIDVIISFEDFEKMYKFTQSYRSAYPDAVFKFFYENFIFKIK